MTDTPNRTIGGLTPRIGGQPDLSRLQRRNRPATPPSLDADRVERASVTSTARPSTPEESTPPAVPAAPITGSGQTSTQDRITVYLDRDLRGRARTAFRATAHLEGDRTWSDFIERAIRTEVERREHLHNVGQAYSSSVDKLPPGRSVS